MAVLTSPMTITHPSSMVSLILLPIVIVLVCYTILTPAYNLLFHPLRKFPGPKLWAASQIPWLQTWLKGQMHHKSLELHNKYGPIVRTGPDEISFLIPEAWDAVMGHRKKGEIENPKAPWYGGEPEGSILGASREDHSRLRRLASHGFSASAILEQQPLITQYIDLLIQRLHENCGNGRNPLDVSTWFSFTTFDIICDLTFGESFGCLRESAMHPWVKLVSSDSQISAIRGSLTRFPILRPFLHQFVSPEKIRQANEHKALTREKVSKRLALEYPRPDFLENIVNNKGNLEMTRRELETHAEVLTVAGSETTATVLSSAFYLLTTHPGAMKKVTDEVRSSFTKEDDIDLLTSVKLPYLNAVLKETLRVSPAIPNALPRITPPEGNTILGHYIPGNTVLSVPHWAMYRSEAHFLRPTEFIPERWLGAPEFASDRRDCVFPFSFGPRNCIGRNLAHTELHIMLARVLWNFDVQLADESKNWIRRQAYVLWVREPLNMYLSPRKK